MPPAPDGGYALLWRKFLEHEYWTEKRVFSRAEAWLDCWWGMAAFDDHERIVAGQRVMLTRSQFIASERFLEKRWKWSRGKVRRFLARAIESGELAVVRAMNGGCAADGTTGGTIYAVVNYDVYQTGGTSDDTTDSTSDGPKIIKGNNSLTDRGGRKTRKPRKPETEYPEDWKPVESHIEKCRNNSLDINRESLRFRNHHTAKGSLFRDWGAAFHHWLDNSIEYRQRNGSSQKPARPQDWEYRQGHPADRKVKP